METVTAESGQELSEATMGDVSVLVLTGLGLPDNFREGIAAVDPRLSLCDASAQFVAELRRNGSEGLWAERLEAELSRASPTAQPAREDIDSLLAAAEVIYGAALFPDGLPARAPRLKWLHCGGVHLDENLLAELGETSVTVTNSSGASATAMAEYVLAQMLMLARDAPRIFANKQSRRWERFVSVELRHRVVGIIGLGRVGTEVARLANGVGMRVVGTRGSATSRQANVRGVDTLYPPAELSYLLAESDFVVI